MNKLYFGVLSILILVLINFQSTFASDPNVDNGFVKYYVSPDSGSDTGNTGESYDEAFASILVAYQQGVGYILANSNDTEFNGVEIVLDAGNYTGVSNLDLNFEYGVKLVAYDNDNIPVLDCQNDISIISAIDTAASIYLEYIQIQNCTFAVDFFPVPLGDDSNVTVSYDVSIENSVFINTLTGVYVQSSESSVVTVVISQTDFSTPILDTTGASINILAAEGNTTQTTVSIDECTFTAVTGIRIKNADHGHINNCQFSNSEGTDESSPAAVWIDGGNWELDNNIVSNVTFKGQGEGAVFYFTTGSGINNNITINGGSFTNSNGTSGGAIGVNSASIQISDVTFDECSAEEGGAIYAMASNVTLLSDVTFTASASSSGVGVDISLINSTLNVYDDSVTFSTDEDAVSCAQGSALYVENGFDNFPASGTCNATYVSESALPSSYSSVPAVSISTTGGGSLWWLWTLLALAIVAIIVVVAAGAGFVVYKKKFATQYESF